MPRVKKNVVTPQKVAEPQSPVLKTNTKKFDYRVVVYIGDKTISSFVARTDSCVNALKSAYEQCCGWTFTPIEPLPEPPESTRGK